jgi:uncharacterized membrane protein
MDEKRTRYLLFGLILFYTLFFGLYTLARHHRFMTSTFDLGIFDQALYLIRNGESLFLHTRGLHVQADHFHPILYLIAPFYLFFPSAKALLFLQTFVIGLGAYPAYQLARHHGLKPQWSLAMALAYLLHPTVGSLNAFDFHPVAVMMTAFMFAVYYLEIGSPIGYAVALVLALSCTEAAGFTVVALAVSAFFIRDYKWALPTFLGGAVALVVSRLWLRYFNHGRTTPYSALYTDYGRNEVDVVGYLLTSPLEAISRLSTPLNWDYMYLLFVPLLLLPLLSPERLLPLVPTLLGNLLSWRPSQHTIYFHYGAALAPFLVWAAIAGWARLRKKGCPDILLGFLLICGTCLSFNNGPIREQSRWYYMRNGYEVRTVLDTIGDDESVVSDCALGSHLSQRQELYLFPNPFLSIAWGSGAPSLFEQASVEYTPISRGLLRRGMESNHPDVVVLAKPGLRNVFPLEDVDSEFCRQQVIRSAHYELKGEDDVAVILRRRKP